MFRELESISHILKRQKKFLLLFIRKLAVENSKNAIFTLFRTLGNPKKLCTIPKSKKYFPLKVGRSFLSVPSQYVLGWYVGCWERIHLWFFSNTDNMNETSLSLLLIFIGPGALLQY